jgi:hypothetical protein
VYATVAPGVADVGFAVIVVKFRSNRVTVPVTVMPLFEAVASGESEPVVTTAEREAPESAEAETAKATAIDVDAPAVSVPAVQRIFEETVVHEPDDDADTKVVPEGIVVSMKALAASDGPTFDRGSVNIQFEPAGTVAGADAVLPARLLDRVTSVEKTSLSLDEVGSGDAEDTVTVLPSGVPAAEAGLLVKTTLKERLAPAFTDENEHCTFVTKSPHAASDEPGTKVAPAWYVTSTTTFDAFEGPALAATMA